jgi:hypothetical protein
MQGKGSVEGRWVDRVVGLEGVQADIAMLQTPDGHGRLELTKFNAPLPKGGDKYAPANTLGIRHVAFAVDDIDAVVHACGLKALRSSASWSATRTATGSATCAARGDHRRTGRAHRMIAIRRALVEPGRLDDSGTMGRRRERISV